MRTAKVGDTIVTLDERDYNQLLKRTNTGKIVDGHIHAACICKHYNACVGCPINGGSDTNYHHGCLDILNTIANDKDARDIIELGTTVHFKVGYQARGIKHLSAIHDFLLRIPKTRR